LFGAQEMATAIQHRINVVGIVFNNDSYGNVRRDQQQTYGGRLIGSELVNPDFVKMAESFGLPAFRAASPDALRRALEQALALDRPCLIEVPVEQGSEVSPWPFIHPPPPAQA
jgi:acetolactate synthase-1/2/3 large subunit